MSHKKYSIEIDGQKYTGDAKTLSKLLNIVAYRNIKDDARDLAGLLLDKANQLKAAVRTLDKRENMQAAMMGCLSSLKATIKHYENLCEVTA